MTEKDIPIAYGSISFREDPMTPTPDVELWNLRQRVRQLEAILIEVHQVCSRYDVPQELEALLILIEEELKGLK